MSETPKVKFSEDWTDVPATMLPGEIAVNAHNTPPTIYTGNTRGEPRPLPPTYIGTSAPPRPVEGTIWLNSSSNALSFWNGTIWVTIGEAGGQYESGDFVGWMDPTLSGGGINPPIDQANAANYTEGSYVRMLKGGWYDVSAGEPVDPSVGGAPANVLYLAVGETLIRDEGQPSGWRQMEDGAPYVGKLALHNLEDISKHWVGFQHEMVDLGPGSTYPGLHALVTTRPVPSVLGDPVDDGAEVIHSWISRFAPPGDPDQRQRALTLWPTGFVTQSPMDEWGNPADPDRPEIPGNPGHLDLFPDYAFLPKASLDAHYGAANAIIQDPEGDHNTIIPKDVNTPGLVIRPIIGTTVNTLQVKREDGTDGFTVNSTGDSFAHGKLGVRGDSHLYGNVRFVDQTEFARNWRHHVSTSGGVMAYSIGADPDADPALRIPSKLGISTFDGSVDHGFVFTEHGQLWLPNEPDNDASAVNLGYLKTYTDDGFIHKTGGVAETADGEKTFSGKLRAIAGVEVHNGLAFMNSDDLAKGWVLSTTDAASNIGHLSAGDYAAEFQIQTKNNSTAGGGTVKIFKFKANGRLQLPLDPAANMDAVTKQYVDTNFLGVGDADGLYMNLTGGVDETADGQKTFTGKLVAQAGILVSNLNDFNKAWGIAVSDAALNQMVLGSSDHASRFTVQTQTATGGTTYAYTFRENGYLQLPRDPTANNHAVRLNYITTKVIDDSQTYRMIRDKGAGDGAWVRSPVAGFLPNATGGASSSLGTSNWRWNNIYGRAANFDSLIVAGEPFAPVDTADLMTLSTNQNAAGEKTFTGKLRAFGGLEVRGGVAAMNSHNTGKGWVLSSSDSANNIGSLNGGDYASQFKILTKNAVGGTVRTFRFTQGGQLELPLSATSDSHAVRRGWVYSNIVDESQTYRGLRGKSGATNAWVRTGTPGLLPYTSGGNSSDLGTSGWRWRNIYGTTGNFSGALTVGGDLKVNGTYLVGDGKNMIQFSDAWLRLNPGNTFTSGIYIASTTRMDGTLTFGSNSYQFSRITNALRVRNSIQASSYRDYKFEMFNNGGTYYGKFALPVAGARENDACTFGQRNSTAVTSEFELAMNAVGISNSAVQYDLDSMDLGAEAVAIKQIAADKKIIDLEKVVLELMKKVAELQP